MSREKFEAWCKQVCLNSKTRQANHLFAAWLAGRESMRAEAMKKCLYSRNSEDVYKAIKELR